MEDPLVIEGDSLDEWPTKQQLEEFEARQAKKRQLEEMERTQAQKRQLEEFEATQAKKALERGALTLVKERYCFYSSSSCSRLRL